MEPLRLGQPVGPSHATAEGDVKTVKRALSALDLLKPSSSSTTGIPNRELFDDIRRFQRSNGLRADAVLEPEGPTARLMNTALKERRSPSKAGKRPAFRSRLKSAVGAGAPNAAKDVDTLRRALTDIGYHPKRRGKQPEAERGDGIDPDLELGIRGLQRDFNLVQDGRIEPGGATERLALRLQSAEAVPPREPLKAQIDDQRRFLAEMRAELETARRDLAAHQKALADAKAELAKLETSPPDAPVPEPPDRERNPTLKDMQRSLKNMNKFARGAAIEAGALMAQIKMAKFRVNELRNDETAKSAVASDERLVRQAEARLEALLRKQREMTGGGSPP